MNRTLALVTVVLAAACGGSSKPAATSTTAATPSCEAIAKACHPHAPHVAVAKECHELGHAASSEDACAARKAECLSACPAS